MSKSIPFDINVEPPESKPTMSSLPSWTQPLDAFENDDKRGKRRQISNTFIHNRHWAEEEMSQP